MAAIQASPSFMDNIMSRTLVERALYGTAAAILSAPFVVAVSALGGFIYAKLAHLPAGQVAKAYAVWAVAAIPFSTLVNFLIKEPKYQYLVKAAIIITSNSIGIFELRRRGLMGDKMMIFTIIGASLASVGYIGLAAHAILSKNKTEE